LQKSRERFAQDDKIEVGGRDQRKGKSDDKSNGFMDAGGKSMIRVF
jgi:hypothetical protein